MGNKYLYWCILLVLGYSFAKKEESPVFFGEDHTSGYIPLDKTYSFFYWFFKSRDRNPDAPLIMWIQGGPGCAATSSALGETGPYIINEDLTVSIRQNSINNFADVIFVDQPLGTGFSNCSNEARIPRNEIGIVVDMLEFYHKFVDKFPNLKNRSLYLVGHSYAGHYVPAIAKYYLEDGIPVKGAAINNGWYDPAIQILMRGVYVRKHNLASFFEVIAGQILEQIEIIFIRLKWPNWAEYVEELVVGLYQGFNHKRFNQYDIREPCPDELIKTACSNDTLEYAFLNRTQVRKELGVGDRGFIDCNPRIEEIMLADNYDDITPYVLNLLNEKNLPMIIYGGEYDFVCDIEGQMAWVKNLKWKYQQELNQERWKDWYINGKSKGLYQQYKNLIHAIVYNAGHIVVDDQPEVMIDAIYKLIYQMK